MAAKYRITLRAIARPVSVPFFGPDGAIIALRPVDEKMPQKHLKELFERGLTHLVEKVPDVQNHQPDTDFTEG